MIRNFVLGLGACAIAMASGCGKAPIVAPSGQSAEIKEKVRSVEVARVGIEIATVESLKISELPVHVVPVDASLKL